MTSFPNNNSNIDNVLLQTLMDRLQLRAPMDNTLITQSLENFLFDDASDVDEDDDNFYEERYGNKAELVKEESKLEKEIIKIIVSGKGDSLKPNSGQAVSVRDHNICVGFTDEENSEYRVWEWHGHIMIYDEEHGYSPEYIYGNYFQRFVQPKPSAAAAAAAEPVEKEEKGNLGLRELIDNKDSNAGRILHRNSTLVTPGTK